MINDLIAVLSGLSFDGFIVLLQEHQFLVSVLLPFFAGELTIHFFGILNGSGDVSLAPAIIAAVSVLFFDIVIYGAVQVLRRYDRLMQHFRSVSFFAKIEDFFKKHEERYRRNQTLLLIAIKLMPMTKATLIFFALCQKMSMAQFIIRDALITAGWVFVIFLPGWLVGREFLTEAAGRQLGTFIIYFVLLIVLMLLFGSKIDRFIMRVAVKIAKKTKKY